MFDESRWNSSRRASIDERVERMILSRKLERTGNSLILSFSRIKTMYDSLFGLTFRTNEVVGDG